MLAHVAETPLNMITRVRNVILAKVRDAIGFGLGMFIKAAKNPHVRRALQSIDSFLSTVDSYVEKYIPDYDYEGISLIFFV